MANTTASTYLGTTIYDLIDAVSGITLTVFAQEAFYTLAGLDATNAMPAVLIVPEGRERHPHTNKIETLRFAVVIWDVSHQDATGEIGLTTLYDLADTVRAALETGAPGTGAISLVSEGEASDINDPSSAGQLQGVISRWTATIKKA